MKIPIIILFAAIFIKLTIGIKESLEILDVTDVSVNLKFIKNGRDYEWNLIVAMNKNRSTMMRSLMKCDKKASSENIQICRISKLTPGTTYVFEVFDKNMDNDSWEFANISSREVTTDNPSDVPEMPSDLKILETTNTTSTIQWQKPVNSFKFVSYNILAYKFYPKRTIISFKYIDSSENPQYKLTGLGPSCKYIFYVSAFNNKGSSQYILSDEVRTS
ncbi:titin-like [Leptopilina heterotoma]|uniref:titin-like n=1 Tax=Leptopilina heterotoma TaxID=63436 RepID=UPI001CA83228|nr:titin-like [Leptopilina heterotoma]